MPTYEYENTDTGKKWTEDLPIWKRNFPTRQRFVRMVISSPNLSTISDVGGKEDKLRESINKKVEASYLDRDKKEQAGIIKVPEATKERRVKTKQKRQWI